MKKKFLNLFAALIVLSLLFSSCGSLVNSKFAKRKYTAGIFINKKENIDQISKDTHATNLPQNEGKETVHNKSEYVLKPIDLEIIKTSNELNKEIKLEKRNEIKKLSTKNSNTDPRYNLTINIKKGRQAKAPYKDNQVESTTEQDNTLLLIKIIIAIFIPPLAVFIHEKATTDFWIDLILWLFFGVGRVLPFFFGFWGVAFIYALFVIMGLINLG